MMSGIGDLHDDIIHPGRLDAEIESLELIGDDRDCYDQADYEELTRFRDAVQAGRGVAAWDDSSGFIADDYFSRYCYHQACDAYGKTVVDLPYWDQGAYEAACRAEFEEFEFDGVTYLVDD